MATVSPAEGAEEQMAVLLLEKFAIRQVVAGFKPHKGVFTNAQVYKEQYADSYFIVFSAFEAASWNCWEDSLYISAFYKEKQNWLPKIAISFWKPVGQNHGRTGRYQYLDWCQHSLGPGMLITVIETQKSDLLKENYGKLRPHAKSAGYLFCK